MLSRRAILSVAMSCSALAGVAQGCTEDDPTAQGTGTPDASLSIAEDAQTQTQTQTQTQLGDGSNVYGMLGRGDPATTPSLPLKVIGIPARGTTKISASAEHTCALTSGGAMYCWGFNSAGQLGVGTPNVNNGCSSACEQTAKKVETSAGVALTGVLDIQATYSGTCATRAGGELYCWGNVTSSNYAVPYLVADAGLDGVREMAYCGSGGSDLRALLTDGGSINTGPIAWP